MPGSCYVHFNRYLQKNDTDYDLTTTTGVRRLLQDEPLNGRFSRQALIERNDMPPRARKEKEAPVEIDPFAPDQDTMPDGDEAQTETPPWEVSDETDVNQGFDRGSNSSTDTNEKAKVITVGSEGKIVSTFKGGRDYDAPWVVIHADDVAESLNIINDKEFAELLTRVQAASQYFQGQAPTSPNTVQQNTSQNGSQGRSQGRPAAVTEGPWGEQSCKHGVMSFKSGVGDDGNVWQGYFCPAPRNSQDKCKNKYVK